MADLFMVKKQLRLSMWLVAVGVVGGLFAVWQTWGGLTGSDGAERERFVLSACVTGALALAWVMLVFSFAMSRWVMDPKAVFRKRRGANVPWWILKILALSVFIGVMVVVLQQYAGRRMDEFELLQKGKIALLEERITEMPELLEKLDWESGKNLLEMALARGNAGAVDMLLSNGAEWAVVADRINLVASLENIPLLEVLLRHGADPDASDADGVSSLHRAAGLGNTNATKVLLKAGGHVNAPDSFYQTPLMWAVMESKLPMAGMLIENGADLDRSDQGGNTALHQAVLKQNAEAVRFLLEQGADLTIYNLDNMAPVHIAALNGQNEILGLFLKIPELVGLCNADDRTPFDQALRKYEYDAARLLLKHGAKIDRVMANGYTALHQMLIDRNYKPVRFLIEEGADVHIIGPEGESAIGLMRKKQLQFLLDLIATRDNLLDS